MAFEVSGAVTMEFAPNTILAGATVKCSLDFPLRGYFDLMGEKDRLRDSSEIDDIEAFYRKFGDIVLVEWDLTLKGEALPANGDSLVRIPFAAAKQIFDAWSDTTSGASPNSSGASESGDTSAALSEVTEQQ